MPDLATDYLGLELRTPLVPSASPLSEEVDNICRMEDAGASAVVLHSLFEEQLHGEAHELHHYLTHGTESYAEALTFFPEPTHFHIGPEVYLNHIQQAKQAVDIPIIASLNGSTAGTWIEYAKQIEQAGADALELNIYWLPSDKDISGAEIERQYLEIVRAVRAAVQLPLAVKLSPFFSSLAHMADQIVSEGANGLVLFNRFYQPDIDIELLEVQPRVMLSTPFALRLPMNWIAILYGRINTDFAASSGIHTHHDVLRMLMAGASVTMLCSVLLKRGIDRITAIEQDLIEWMNVHEYESVRQMQGSVSQQHSHDPSAFERAQYTRAIQTYWPER